MFARSSDAAYTCLRCLSQVNRRAPIRVVATRFVGPTRKRKYAIAALATVEDLEEDHEQAKEESQGHLRTHAKYKDRVWIPAPAEKLGVPSLGKPAEVLVLPSRERRIPVVPHGSEDTSHHIQEALDSESKPVTAEQVTRNIEQVREHALRFGVAPDDAVRRNLRRDLVQGFSFAQLMRYIEHTQRPKTRKFHYSTQKGVKQQAAGFIVNRLWGIGGDNSAEVIEKPHQPRMVGFSRWSFEAVLNQKANLIQRLSEKYNVKIDIFRDEGRLLVTPFAGSAIEAIAAIHELKRNIRRRILQLDGALEGVQRWERSKLDRFLDRIGQKHEGSVHFQATPPRLWIYYHKDSVQAVENIRREVLLACMPQRHLSSASAVVLAIWPVEEVRPTTLVPTYPTSPRPSDFLDCEWGRYIYHEKANLLPCDLSVQRVEESSGLQRIEKTIHKHLARSDGRFNTIPTFCSELRIDFGQYLTDRHKSHSDPSKIENFMFTDAKAIPMLSHYLAARRRIDLDSTTAFMPKFLARLILKPVHGIPEAPTIEMFLSGSDADAGFNQKLTVQRAKAILEHRFFILLLPGSAIDLRFSLLNTASIYEDGVKPRKLFSTLLNQLGDYFARAKGLEQAHFAPFLHLHIPSILLGRKPPGLNGKESHNYEAQKGSKTGKPAVASGHEYIVHAAEILDICSLKPPGKTRLILDHVFSDGNEYGPSSQALSLAGQSIWARPAERNISVRELLTGGLQIAKHFSGPKILTV